MMKRTERSASSHSERQGKGTSWGDNGRARPASKKYLDNYDAIFGKTEKA